MLTFVEYTRPGLPKLYFVSVETSLPVRLYQLHVLHKRLEILHIFVIMDPSGHQNTRTEPGATLTHLWVTTFHRFVFQFGYGCCTSVPYRLLHTHVGQTIFHDWSSCLQHVMSTLEKGFQFVSSNSGLVLA